MENGEYILCFVEDGLWKAFLESDFLWKIEIYGTCVVALVSTDSLGDSTLC